MQKYVYTADHGVISYCMKITETTNLPGQVHTTGSNTNAEMSCESLPRAAVSSLQASNKDSCCLLEKQKKLIMISY